MHKYKCNCGYVFEYYLKIYICPKCEGKKLKLIKEKTLIKILENEDIPQSKKFMPIYYQDKLWYYRRYPKNSKKQILKALNKKIENKPSWE